MTGDTSARQLHDRATRGGALTDTERATLEAWYKQRDHEEAALLGPSASAASTALDALCGELTTALTRLREETQRIQAQADENEAMRREIAALSERLARAGSRQPKQGAVLAPCP